MTRESENKLLKLALIAFGVVFCLVYPLGLIWPSGWVWHGGQGKYYLQMIAGIYAVLGVFLIIASQNPSEHRSLISFTIWSSVAQFYSGVDIQQNASPICCPGTGEQRRVERFFNKLRHYRAIAKRFVASSRL